MTIALCVNICALTLVRVEVLKYKKLEAVEPFNELKRHKEEKSLLFHEMKNWLHYYQCGNSFFLMEFKVRMFCDDWINIHVIKARLSY